MTVATFHCFILAAGCVCAAGTAIEDARTPPPARWRTPAVLETDAFAPATPDETGDFAAAHPQFVA